MTRWDGEVVTRTARLALRTFREDDLPRYAALNADPEVMAHLGGPISAEASREVAAWANDRWADDGVGLLAVERREDGAFLGMSGLHHLSSLPDELEVAWRLARPHWGHGYATEAATAWLDRAFGDLGVDHVISVTEAENTRSLAVMGRLGFAFDREADLVEDGDAFRAQVYVLRASAWSGRDR